MFYTGYKCYEDVSYQYGDDHILAAYGIPFGQWIQSPLPGRQDDTPSFITNKAGRSIIWKDFGYIGKSGKLELLVQLLEGISDGPELAKRILQRLKSTPVPRPNITRQSAVESGIEYSRYYNKNDVKYWKELGLSPEYLLENDYYVCRQLSMDGRLIWKNTINKPTYVYIDNVEKEIWQAYRPLNAKGEKHISWNTNHVLLGKKFVTNYSHIIFGSSVKDSLVTRHLKFQSVNYGGEAIIPDEEFAAKTLKIFKRAYCYMNNDTTGLKVTEMYKALGFIPILNPPGTPKDPSDFKLSLGEDALLKNIKSQL